MRCRGPGHTCLLSTLPLPAEYTFVSQAGNWFCQREDRDCDPEVPDLDLRPWWPETFEPELRHPRPTCGHAMLPLKLEGEVFHAPSSLWLVVNGIPRWNSSVVVAALRFLTLIRAGWSDFVS